MTVEEEVGGGPVDQLESLGGDGGPVGGGDPFPHDAAGDRDELEVDVGDALALNPTGHLFDRLVPPVLIHEAFEVCHYGCDPSLVNVVHP